MPSLWRIDSVGELAEGELDINTIHAHQEIDNIVDGGSVARGFDSTIGNARLACLTSAYTHAHTLATCIAGFNVGVQGLSFDLAGVAGSAGLDGEDNWVCAIVAKLTAQTGKAWRGRVFLSPIAAGTVNPDGDVTPDPAWSAFGDALISGFVADTLEEIDFAVLATPSAWPTFVKFMVSYAIRALCGILRRRRKRVSGP